MAAQGRPRKESNRRRRRTPPCRRDNRRHSLPPPRFFSAVIATLPSSSRRLRPPPPLDRRATILSASIHRSRCSLLHLLCSSSTIPLHLPSFWPPELNRRQFGISRPSKFPLVLSSPPNRFPVLPSAHFRTSLQFENLSRRPNSSSSMIHNLSPNPNAHRSQFGVPPNFRPTAHQSPVRINRNKPDFPVPELSDLPAEFSPPKNHPSPPRPPQLPTWRHPGIHLMSPRRQSQLPSRILPHFLKTGSPHIPCWKLNFWLSQPPPTPRRTSSLSPAKNSPCLLPKPSRHSPPYLNLSRFKFCTPVIHISEFRPHFPFLTADLDSPPPPAEVRPRPTKCRHSTEFNPDGN